MTEEFRITNPDCRMQFAKEWRSSYGFRRSLVDRISSLVIHFLVFIIRLYRWTVSPALPFLFGPTGGCRFTPTCSQYAMDAIRSRGALTGGWLAVKRICRCHPLGDCGHDPAPETEFRIPPSPIRLDAAGIEPCRAAAGGEGGDSEFRT